MKSVIRNENISEENENFICCIDKSKRKLIITGTSKDLDDAIEKIQKQKQIYAKKNGKINPILVKKYRTYLDWILLVYEYEKGNTDNLIEFNQILQKDIVETKTEETQEITAKSILENLNSYEVRKEQLEEIKKENRIQIRK